MEADANEVEATVRRLVDDYRDRCLWFLRQDYYPARPAEILRVLDQVERHGDRAAHLRAAEIRRWLSRTSSDGSVGS